MATAPPTFAVRGSLDVAQKTTLHGDVTAAGKCTVTGDTVIAGTLKVIGNSDISGTIFANTGAPLDLNKVNAVDVTVSHLLETDAFAVTNGSALNSLTCSGTATLNGALVTTGDVTLGDTAADVILMNGGVNLNSTLGCAGYTTLHGLTAGASALDSLGVGGATTLSGTSHLIGDGTFDGNLTASDPTKLATLPRVQAEGVSTFSEDVTLNKALTTTGYATLSGGAAVAGATVTGSSGLTVTTGPAVLQSLRANGATTFADSVTVSDACDVAVGTGTTTLGGYFTAGAGSSLVGDVAMGGKLSVPSGESSLSTLSATGAATLSGAVTAGSTLTVAGLTTLNGTAICNASTTFNGDSTWSSGKTLTVTNGLASLGGPLTVGGVSTFNSSGTFGDGCDLTVGGAGTFGALTGKTSLSTDAGSATTLGGTCAVTGALTANGAFVANGTTALKGATDLQGTVNATADVTLRGVNNVLGNFTTGPSSAVTLGNGCTVNGAAAVNGPLTSTGAGGFDSVSVTNGLTVTGASAVAALTAQGAVTARGSLTAQGSFTGAAASFSENVTLSKDLTVNGTTAVKDLTAAAASTASLVNLSTSGTAALAGLSVTGGTAVALGSSDVSTTGTVAAGPVTASTVATTAGITCGAALSVNGAITVADGVTASACSVTTATADAAAVRLLQVDGQLNVAAAASTTFGGGVTVGGAATVGAALGVIGDCTVQGTVAAGALNASRYSVFRDDVSVTGSVTTGAAVICGGDATVAGNSTLHAVACTGVDSSGDLRYNGTLYRNTFPIRFGPYGADFNPPQIAILATPASVTSSQIALTLDPVQQVPLGVWSIMLPQVTSLTVTVQLTAGGNTALVLASSAPENITTVRLFCYADDDGAAGITGRMKTGSASEFQVYGLQPAGDYTVGLYYSNDTGSAPAYYETALIMPAAGPPAAPSMSLTSYADDSADNSVRSFALFPGALDSANPAASPQPAVSKYVVTYSQTSSMADRTGADSGTVQSADATTATVSFRAGTAYTCTAVVYNKVLPSSSSPVSQQFKFWTGYDITRFSKGASLIDGASFAAPAASQRFPAAQYVCRTGAQLLATDLLTGPSWTHSLSGLRANYEPHPTHALAVSDWTLAITGDAAGDSASVSTLWADAAAKTATSTQCALTIAAPTDANVAGKSGFFKTIETASLSVTNAYAGPASHALQFKQTLHQRGDWSYASAGNSLTYASSALVSRDYVNGCTFWVDDAASLPSVSAVTELQSARSCATSVRVSGLSSLPLAGAAVSGIVAVSVANIGRYWFPVGTAAALGSPSDSSALTGAVSDSATACAAIYADVALTQPLAAASPPDPSVTYHRSVPFTVNSAAWTSGVKEQVQSTATASNLIGAAASPLSWTLRDIRCDVDSLLHPHFAGSGQSTSFGQRVVLQDGAGSAFPAPSTVYDTYDHSQVIVGNGADARYNFVLGLYGGVYSGTSGLWRSDWSARTFRMSAGSVFPDYSSPAAATRFVTFRYPNVNSSASFHHVRVLLNGARNPSDAHAIYYRYVDDVDGSDTTPWKDLLLPGSGSISSGADGSGGRYASSDSTTDTSTSVPANDSGTLFIRVGVPDGSRFAFGTVGISDFDTGAPLAYSY